MKKCPFCAEDIQDEAIICRYCGSDQPAAEKPVRKVTSSRQSRIAERKKRSTAAKTVTFVVIVAALCLITVIVLLTRGQTTAVPVPSQTQTPSAVPTDPPTDTPTITLTSTITETPTDTFTATITPSPTRTYTATPLPGPKTYIIDGGICNMSIVTMDIFIQFVDGGEQIGTGCMLESRTQRVLKWGESGSYQMGSVEKSLGFPEPFIIIRTLDGQYACSDLVQNGADVATCRPNW